MWTHCIVCAKDLGSNKEVEHFQVGSRLAFDLTKGRLWAVCPHCNRWNLTPLEERWEALEELERLWESTPAKAASETIGLARLRSGMEVVRVAPESVDGEVAWWRWGRGGAKWWQGLEGVPAGFTAMTGVTVSVALMGGAPLGLAVALAAGFGLPIAGLSWYAVKEGFDEANPVARGSGPSTVTRRELVRSGLETTDDELGWSIHLNRFVSEPVQGRFFQSRRLEYAWEEFSGDDAKNLARRAFPMLNRKKADHSAIYDALKLIAENGGAQDYLRAAAAEKPRWVKFRDYPTPMKLALEMVLFQEEERVALEGELEHLTAAWEEAEALAEISDNLITPKGWGRLLAKKGPTG